MNDGGFVIVYEDENGSATDQAIYTNEWSTTVAGVVTIDAVRDIATSPVAGDVVGTPTVTAASDGSYTVGYQFTDNTGPAHQLVYVNVDATGVVGSQTNAVTGADAMSMGTSSARLTDGNVALVHDYGTADNAITYSVHTPPTGTPSTGGQFVANTNTNGVADFGATITALTGGGFVIARSSTTGDIDIQFQRYNNAGVVQGGVTTVANDGSSDNNTEVSLVAMEDGGFLVLWNDGEAGQETGRGQRYDASGTTVGAVFSFDGSTANHIDVVLLDDGRVALTWQNGEIQAAILDTRDVPNGTEAYTPESYVIGTPGDDDFTSATSADKVYTHDGNDVIHEFGITKNYYGGRGVDTIDWTGNTFESGGTTLVFDLKAGTAENGVATEVMDSFENLIGTNGDDEIYGNGQANALFGRIGDDLIRGRNGGELKGHGGADTLDGGKGKDSVDGGGGGDDLRGGGGADVLKGWSGSDTLNGNKGNDVRVGGGASNTFVFVRRFGNDTIRDFAENNQPEDIDLSGVRAIRNFQDLKKNHMYQDGSDVVIDDNHGNTITVLDASLGDMNKGDFIF